MIASYAYADRGRLALRGADRVRFLHGMVTADVEKLADGQGTRAAMLSVKGRLLAELTLYATADELLLSLDADLVDKVRTTLDKHIVMDDAEVVDRTGELGELGIYGDDAPAHLAQRTGADAAALTALAPYHHLAAGEVRIARDPQLGGVGFRVLGPAARLGAIAEGLPALDAAEREARRVEAGTARYGLDLDEERLIVEANLEDAISFDKGCYLGQEVVVRATSRGRVNRKLVGLVLTQPAPRAAKLSAAVQAEAGVVTSPVDSPRLGPIALGYVHRTAIEAKEPLLVEGGARAEIVALPFDPSTVAAARQRLA